MIGNLHINIIADKWDPKVEKLIEPFVYEVVGTFGQTTPSSCTPLLAYLHGPRARLTLPAEKNGSISAEHGLGTSFSLLLF